MILKEGDLIQIVYKDTFKHTIQVIESKFISKDSEYLTLSIGSFKFRNIKGLRNLTEEQDHERFI